MSGHHDTPGTLLPRKDPTVFTGQEAGWTPSKFEHGGEGKNLCHYWEPNTSYPAHDWHEGWTWD